LHDIFSLKALPNMDSQSFPGVAIEHGEHAQFAAIKQFVGHKVHAPHLVDPLGLNVWLA
jgi:hypothetical protein